MTVFAVISFPSKVLLTLSLVPVIVTDCGIVIWLDDKVICVLVFWAYKYCGNWTLLLVETRL